MTDTELKHRLTAAVDHIDAPSDLVHRVRKGGTSRLRRRRLTAVIAAGLTLVAIAGASTVIQYLPTPAPAHPNISDSGGIGSGDPYGFMMKGKTRGDLAGDKTFLAEAVAAWEQGRMKTYEKERGIYDDLRGGSKVYWAGNTPAGKAAIIVQNSFLHEHGNMQIDREGIHTLVGYVGTDAAGKTVYITGSYPTPGPSLDAAFVTGPSKQQQAMVVIDLGKDMGWAYKREYTKVGGSIQKFAPLRFADGVSVVKVPLGTDPYALQVSLMPPDDKVNYQVVNGLPPATSTEDFDKRLWTGDKQADGSVKEVAWPMTDGADALAASANDNFVLALVGGSDPGTQGTYLPAWVGYGLTPNGSTVLLSELQLDPDPTHVYAVVIPKGKQATIVQGGVPDPKAPLPVKIKLPGNQGWAVAAKDADLSYRFGTGTWSAPRKNALLVPAGSKPSVRVTLGTGTHVVWLR
ncbi:hypothetical protein GCM10009554_74260 [Kribbella koreensis]|uniref:Uncharacterized protein n=1 Tax=Kribbella koreensis TaxID=57909 RepID=A0ABN1RMA2_9ACTN